MIEVTQRMTTLFGQARERALASGHHALEVPTEYALSVVMGELQTQIEGMPFTAADENFVRRMAEHATAEEWPELLFRCYTALIMSKLSREREL